MSTTTPARPTPDGLAIGIVGATGLVGEFMLSILAQRRFPVRALRLFVSPGSAGRQLPWNGMPVTLLDMYLTVNRFYKDF